MKRDILVIESFLNGINLSLNQKKTRFIYDHQGVPFLGMVVKGRAILPGKRIIRNFRETSSLVVNGEKDIETIASYLGILCHSNSGRAIDTVFSNVGWNYNW